MNWKKNLGILMESNKFDLAIKHLNSLIRDRGIKSSIIEIDRIAFLFSASVKEELTREKRKEIIVNAVKETEVLFEYKEGWLDIQYITDMPNK